VLPLTVAWPRAASFLPPIGPHVPSVAAPVCWMFRGGRVAPVAGCPAEVQ